MVLQNSQAPAAFASSQVVQALEDIYGQGDLSKIEALFTPDYVEHDPGNTGARHGSDSVTGFVVSYRRAFAGLELTLPNGS